MNRRGPLFAALGSALVVLLAVFFLVMPKMNAVKDTQGKFEQAQGEESSLRTKLGSLQQAQSEAPQNRREIRKTEQQIPPTVDPAGIIRLINTQARDAAVDFVSIAPGTPTVDASGQFSVVAINVTAGGEFANLDDFLSRLESLDRAAKVITIAVTGQQEAPAPPISIQLQVEMYTTDTSAGPGSVPGTTEAGEPAA